LKIQYFADSTSLCDSFIAQQDSPGGVLSKIVSFLVCPYCLFYLFSQYAGFYWMSLR